VTNPVITRNLLVTRPGYTGTNGISAASLSNLRIHGNHIVRFTTPVNNGGVGTTYGNSTTASSISPDTNGNRTNQTPTFVDETNWNYVLSINDTSAKYFYGAWTYSGIAVSLYHNGITGYRFPHSSIGPTDPDPGTYPPWLTKVVNTDGGGDFTSLNAALTWLYNNYVSLVQSNIRAKFICMGAATDNTNVTTSISSTDPIHYIHIVAHDDYRFRGIPNLTNLYKRSAFSIPTGYHLIIEGIQVNQGTTPTTESFLAMECYISIGGCPRYNCVNSIIELSSVGSYDYSLHSFINCTVVNTEDNGLIPELRFGVNCIHVGSVLSSSNRWYYTLGAVTNYSSGVTSLFGKYGETVTFKNASQNDYRLSWNDTAAKNQGIYAGSYLEDIVDVELYKRTVRSSYGADEPCAEYTESLYGSEAILWAPTIVDNLHGADSLGIRGPLEVLYCHADDVYRGALSGRILIRVQKKTSRIYRA
jgi:hypothetical protein